MGYLSPEIEDFAKKKKTRSDSLVKKERSCGIFQDYGFGEVVSGKTDKE
ncbi:hypothetical protein FK220_011115 [Flavobacteriaceae bacterium TP-CH-4]|uniref:Uncharacterized protein n=1 Tax=Pelagihabitans pacificus TaxID=2696054 RepID=A0A967AVL7_9FLAO|nr:hypothetical protein [Pelagihabitans pacificus]NHF59893.1 hypothetical protein [Pelagihabitans pacificus]